MTTHHATATLRSVEPRSILLIVSDTRTATLYRGLIEAPARIRLNSTQSLDNAWMKRGDDFHEHHRPTSLGRGPTKTAGQHVTALGHEPEELEMRFAHEVAELIRRERKAAPSSAVAIFASPRFLGRLRDVLTPLAGDIELFRGEFAGLSREEIASHPTIRLLVSGLTKHTRGTK